MLNGFYSANSEFMKFEVEFYEGTNSIIIRLFDSINPKLSTMAIYLDKPQAQMLIGELQNQINSFKNLVEVKEKK